jgi:hypothetical protein
MALEFTTCPVCGQRLGVYDYMLVGSEVVCANPRCLTTLRVKTWNPLKVDVVPVDETYNADSRPESYA